MSGEMGSCCVTPSKVQVVVLLLLLHCSITFSQTTGWSNVTARPKVVNVGALFSLNSTIGKAAKVAIDAAVDDINSNSSILSGTKLVINTHDTNCSGFLGIVEALHFMETDTVAIIGPQSSELAHVISHVANELQVPLLSFAATDPTLSSLQYPFFVRSINSDLFQMSAIAEIVDFYNWRQVIAIFLDDDYGRNGVAALGDKLAERRCKVSYKAALRPGATKSDVTDLLVKVVLMESRVIVLHANPNSGLTVLSVARSLGMMGNGYVWIATDWLSSWLDTSHLDSVNMDNLQGVIGLRQHTADTDRKRTLTSRWSNLTQQKGGVFGMNAYALYAYDTVWIVARAIDAFFNNGGVVSFSNDSRIKDKGGNLHLESMSIFNGGSLLLNEILKTDMIGVTGTVQFDSARQFIHPAYDIINVVGNGFRGVGYWSNYSGLSVVPPETLYKRLANRSRASQQLYPVIWPGQTVTKPRGWAFPNNGVELKIGYPLRATYKQFLSRANGSDVVRGYCIDVFTAAVSLLPYAVPVKFVPFGDGLKNPSYTELVNRVASGELDGAIGDIAIVTNRTKIVDFTQPYIESGLVILTSIKKQKPNTWAFLQPFTLEMWLVTGGFFLVIGIVVWILEHRLNDEFRGPPRKQIVTICWFTFSTLFFSHKENTVSTLGRFVLLIWLFVVLIIQSSYTASLTSILTVQQLSSPIKGIDSLIASKDPIGFQVGSFAENYMIEDLGISKSRLRTLNTPDDYARALELGPENGGVMAVVDERPYVDLFLSTHCKFTVIGSEFTKSGWGFAFPRDSPLAVDMSTAILTLSENGDLQRISDKWLARSACSSDSTQLDSARLHLSSFSGLFLICGTACVIALLIYLFLVLRKFYRDRHSQEVDDSSKSGGSRSFVGLQRFLSFYDEKEQEAKERRKKKILEGSSSNGSSGGFSSVP